MTGQIYRVIFFIQFNESIIVQGDIGLDIFNIIIIMSVYSILFPLF